MGLTADQNTLVDLYVEELKSLHKQESVTLPDFVEWATVLQQSPRHVLTDALNEAFTKGYHLGKRLGEQNGRN